MEQNNQKIISPHELARIFESQIKKIIWEKFSVSHDDLALLLGDENGAYLSQEEPDTLCCLVVGEKNGFLYLVTAKIKDGGKNLIDFKSDIVS